MGVWVRGVMGGLVEAFWGCKSREDWNTNGSKSPGRVGSTGECSEGKAEMRDWWRGGGGGGGEWVGVTEGVTVLRLKIILHIMKLSPQNSFGESKKPTNW